MENMAASLRNKVRHLKTFSKSSPTSQSESDPETYGVTRRLAQIAISPAFVATPSLAERVYMRVSLRRPPKRRPTAENIIQERTQGAFSLLLSLPVEIQMEIIDIIEEERRQQPKQNEEDRHPLIALRGTCKDMDRLCSPVLFSELDVRNLTTTRLAPLLVIAPKLSVYLKHVTIAPRDPDRFDATDGLDEAYFTILQHAVNVRKLTILYDGTDIQCHPILAPLYKILTKLDSLEFLEINTSPGSLDRSLTFSQKGFRTFFLDSYLQQSPLEQLRSLRLGGLTPLPRETLEVLKKRTNLYDLDLQQGFAEDDREWLDDWSEAGRWACRSSLTTLRLTYNRGVHASAIVNVIAGGALSECLESLTMWFCGSNSDSITLPALPFQRGVWAPRRILKRLELDHYADWEMESLKFLRTEECFLTRCGDSRDTLVRFMSGNVAFVGLKRLHVTAGWNGADWEALVKACDNRNVVAQNDWPSSSGGSCFCHPGMFSA